MHGITRNVIYTSRVHMHKQCMTTGYVRGNNFSRVKTKKNNEFNPSD